MKKFLLLTIFSGSNAPSMYILSVYLDINSFLQRKYRLVNPTGVIEKRICDFTTECQKSSHLWPFLFVPCL